MTVADFVAKMKKSQGFVIFTSTAVKNPETGEITLEHDYLRNQYTPEDLEKSFVEFQQMLAKDLSDSGVNLIKSAEAIVNSKIAPTGTEHKST